MRPEQIGIRTTDPEEVSADPETVAADPEIARKLSHVHQTLELSALLLAVLLLDSEFVGFVAGACAIVLLVGNAVTRAIGG